MATPTMDRAIAALDAGDTETARRLCEEMKHEWRFLHDLMVEGIAGLISYVQQAMGDDAVADAWRYGNERGWKSNVESIDALPRKEVVKALASTWRAHSTSGVGPKPGAFTITEDDEKFTFSMNPAAQASGSFGSAATRATTPSAPRTAPTTGRTAATTSRSTAPTARS